MSSATSIKPRARVGEVRRKPDATEVRLKPDGSRDDGFRPWHFFVLASLMTATVAVILSRQGSPEHLVLLSFTIAAAGVAAAAFYRMLAPLATEDMSIFSEPLSERARAATEREKTLVLRSIKELEFDRAMGKIAPKDFDEMVGRLRARAITLMKQLDEGTSAGYRDLIERELKARIKKGAMGAVGARGALGAMGALGALGAAAPIAPRAPTAPSAPECVCGTVNDADASFCKRCGRKLEHVAAEAR